MTPRKSAERRAKHWRIKLNRRGVFRPQHNGWPEIKDFTYHFIECVVYGESRMKFRFISKNGNLFAVVPRDKHHDGCDGYIRQN